jgi:hypothetical protein
MTLILCIISLHLAFTTQCTSRRRCEIASRCSGTEFAILETPEFKPIETWDRIYFNLAAARATFKTI